MDGGSNNLNETNFFASNIETKYFNSRQFEFQRLWMNERFTDELLKYDEELVSSIIKGLEKSVLKC